MTKSALAVVIGALGVLAVAPAAESGRLVSTKAPGPCSETTVGAATIHVYCGPAKATVKFGGKTVTFKGGSCGVASRSGIKGWSLGIGKFTVLPAKPKFKYFGVAWVGPAPKAGTYKKGEFVVTFFLPGKSYAVVGSALGTRTMKVTATKGARKATFTGLMNGMGPPISGSWSC
jgi:hypothetical protein